jgi:hypothetical protein
VTGFSGNIVERRQALASLATSWHRIADQHRLAPGSAFAGRPAHKRWRSPRRRRQQPVNAEHGILLVEDGRNPRRAGRKQSREGRIAAEADHRIRPELPIECFGLAPPGDHRANGLQPGDRPAADPPGWQDMDRHVVEQAGNARPALVGDQADAVTAPGWRQRMGRDHMSAGAAGRQNHIHAASFSPLHFTT